MGDQGNKSGFFEEILMVLGGISGAIFGFNNGEWVGLIIGAVVLGGIGKAVGALADWTVKLIVLILMFAIHRAVWRFIWSIITTPFE